MARLLVIFLALTCSTLAQALPQPVCEVSPQKPCDCDCGCRGQCGRRECVLPSCPASNPAATETQSVRVTPARLRVAAGDNIASAFPSASALTASRDALVVPVYLGPAASVPLFQEHCCLRL